MSSAATPADVPLQKWPIYALFAVVAWGLVIGAMMTWHHDQQLYGGVQAELIGCVESAAVNCDRVNTSAWSEFPPMRDDGASVGVPIAALSMAAYAAVGVFGALALAGRRQAHALWVAAGAVGTLAALFLAYQSKVELGYWCLYCLQHYAVNFGILGLGLAAGKPRAADLDPAAAGAGAGLLVAFVAVVGFGERIYRQSLLGDAPVALGEVHAPQMTGDPKGPAPTRTFRVTTEDTNKATNAPYEVDLALAPDDAWRGDPTSPVVVVEFADLQCGFCKRMAAEMTRLYAAYGDRVLFVYKHFPMNPDCNDGVNNKKHAYACAAAAASVCAQEQGQFWAWSDLAFKNQHQLGTQYLRAYADTLKLDGARFDACLADGKAMDKVRRDAAVGATLHIHGTPRIYINGKLYRSGTSAEAMARAIELGLGTSEADAQAAAASLRETEEAITAIPADVAPMQKVEIGGLKFSIDTFEAAIVDGTAVSAKHTIPALRTSWYDAKAACEAAGKRMCTEEEWVTVCQNARAVDENGNQQFADDMIEGTAYPYADYHDKGRCWDGRGDGTAPDGTPWRPVFTGEMPRCVTPTGVYDMTGNVEEWVGDSPDRAALIGGAFDTGEDHARCYRRNERFGAGYATQRTGFRCCGG